MDDLGPFQEKSLKTHAICSCFIMAYTVKTNWIQSFTASLIKQSHQGARVDAFY